MDQFIKIRVSADDKAHFENAAEARGLNLSSWARMTLKDAAPRYESAAPEIEKMVDRDIRAAIKKGLPK